jgi:AraC family transcriptional regulator
VQTDTPAALVAEQLGFSSQSHFTRAFRQFTGRTPSEFRRQDRLQ